MRFDAPTPPAEGMTRRWVVYANGYYKWANTDIPHTVDPLPFAAMSNYPYPDTEQLPDRRGPRAVPDRVEHAARRRAVSLTAAPRRRTLDREPRRPCEGCVAWVDARQTRGAWRAVAAPWSSRACASLWHSALSPPPPTSRPATPAASCRASAATPRGRAVPTPATPARARTACTRRRRSKCGLCHTVHAAAGTHPAAGGDGPRLVLHAVTTPPAATPSTAKSSRERARAPAASHSIDATSVVPGGAELAAKLHVQRAVTPSHGNTRDGAVPADEAVRGRGRMAGPVEPPPARRRRRQAQGDVHEVRRARGARVVTTNAWAATPPSATIRRPRPPKPAGVYGADTFPDLFPTEFVMEDTATPSTPRHAPYCQQCHWNSVDVDGRGRARLLHVRLLAARPSREPRWRPRSPTRRRTRTCGSRRATTCASTATHRPGCRSA